MAPSADSTKSGIHKLDTGESVIPSSTRADGSVRKQIRVKPGYRPPEDVEVYQNRTAQAWKNRGKAGVPGADPAGEENLPPHKAAALAGRNAKRREARKKAAAAAGDEEVPADVSAGGKADQTASTKTGEAAPEVVVDPEVEQAKEARKLAKKLRQARELQEKKTKGEQVLPEQLLKITRIQELTRQLDSLGFDQDGEKKSSGNAPSGPPTD